MEDEARRALERLGSEITLKTLRLEVEATLQQPLSVWKTTLRDVATQFAEAEAAAAAVAAPEGRGGGA